MSIVHIAAEAEFIETITMPEPYGFPDNPNLKFWDTPGISTPNFLEDEHLKKSGSKDMGFLNNHGQKNYTK